jgi:MFS family permease
MPTVSMQTWANLANTTRDARERYRGVIRRPATRALLGAAGVSVIGDWLNLVALMTISYELGHGAIGVGGLLALRMTPGLVLQGPAGALVDRFPGKRLLVASQLTMALVAWSFLTVSAIGSIWLLYGLVLLLETINTIARPAFLVQLVRSVTDDQRGAVNGLIGMAMTVAQFIGATIGAVIIAIVGPRPLFVLNGLTFVIIALIVSRVLSAPTFGKDVRSADLHESADSGPAGSQPISGYRPMLRRLDVIVYCLLTFTASIMIQSSAALFEERARSLSLEEGGSGIFFGAVAIGLLVGGAIAGAGLYRTPATLKLVALAEAASAVCLVVFGMANRLPIAVVALMLTGAAAELAEVPALTYFQHRFPVAVYGRFFSLFLMASAAGGLTGALGGPLLARQFDDARALQLIALPILIAALILLFTSQRLQASRTEAEALASISRHPTTAQADD